jgi:hypothetical protein
MLKNIVFILLIGFTGTAVAASWIRAQQDSDGSMFVDKERMWRSDGTVKMWSMNDFTQPKPSFNPPGSGLPNTFVSTISLMEYDCNERKTRILQGYAYEDHKGEGRQAWEMRGPREWDYIKPSSNIEVLWNIACKK